MPRTKITPQQQDDYRVDFIPTPEQIREGCKAAREARQLPKRGPLRKLTEPGGIREFSHRDLGLSDPVDIEGL